MSRLPGKWRIFWCVGVLAVSFFPKQAFSQEPETFPVSRKVLERFDRKFQRYNERVAKVLAGHQLDSIACDSIEFRFNQPDSTVEKKAFALRRSNEFLMGQPDLAEWNEGLASTLEMSRLSRAHAHWTEAVSSCSQLADDQLQRQLLKLQEVQDKLSSRLAGYLDKEANRLQSFVAKSPGLQQLKEHFDQMQAFDRQQQNLAGSTMGMQTQEVVANSFAEHFGTSPEQAMRLVSEKIADASESIERAQQKALNTLNEPQRAEQWHQNFVSEFGLSLNRNTPATADLRLGLGYRVTGKLTMGAGFNQRFNLGNDFRSIRIRQLGRGYYGFAQQRVWRGFFARASYERFTGQTELQPDLSTIPVVHQSWQEAVLVGVGKSIPVGRKLQLSTVLSYRVSSGTQTQFPQRWIFRMNIHLN